VPFAADIVEGQYRLGSPSLNESGPIDERANNADSSAGTLGCPGLGTTLERTPLRSGHRPSAPDSPAAQDAASPP